MRFVDMVTFKGDNKACGNHTKFPLTPTEPGQEHHGYRYYRTMICETIVNPDGTKMFWAGNNGYHSRSTSHAVAMYRNHLVQLGYVPM